MPYLRVASPTSGKSSQQGITIIEVLISLLIFSVGLLGVVGLYNSAVRTSTGAEFRTTAAMLASDLIGRMWMSDRSNAMLKGTYSSTPPGGGYVAWANTVSNSGLPNVNSNPPVVDFSAPPVPGGGATPVSSTSVVITIKWQEPGDNTVHQYVATAQMKP